MPLSSARRSPRRRYAIALVVAALALAACGGSSDKKATTTTTKPKKTTTSASTTTTTIPAPIAPLTGRADLTGQSAGRPALTVKINNTAPGRPTWGLDQADVVYEEVVEGQATRYAAIFQSQAPDRIGPVRSVRKTDQAIVWPIGGIFAYSGGAKYAIDSINTAPVVQIDETRAQPDAMFRDRSRQAPYNLYGVGPKLFAKGAAAKPVPPPALFTYRSETTPPAGDPASKVAIGFKNGDNLTFTWDPATSTWKRSIKSGPEMSATGVQIAPQNVIVQLVPYESLGAIGGEAVMTGSGDAYVFSGPKVVKGTWQRPDKAKPTRYVDATGADIPLTPGQTFVELPAVGYPVTVTP